jgi:hypothetical protein
MYHEFVNVNEKGFAVSIQQGGIYPYHFEYNNVLFHLHLS